MVKRNRKPARAALARAGSRLGAVAGVLGVGSTARMLTQGTAVGNGVVKQLRPGGASLRKRSAELSCGGCL